MEEKVRRESDRRFVTYPTFLLQYERFRQRLIEWGKFYTQIVEHLAYVNCIIFHALITNFFFRWVMQEAVSHAIRKLMLLHRYGNVQFA